MLFLFTLSRHNLNEDGLRFFLMILITSDSVLFVFSNISSKVILSAQPAQMIQSSESIFFGSGFLIFVLGQLSFFIDFYTISFTDFIFFCV